MRCTDQAGRLMQEAVAGRGGDKTDHGSATQSHDSIASLSHVMFCDRDSGSTELRRSSVERGGACSDPHAGERLPLSAAADSRRGRGNVAREVVLGNMRNGGDGVAPRSFMAALGSLDHGHTAAWPAATPAGGLLVAASLPVLGALPDIYELRSMPAQAWGRGPGGAEEDSDGGDVEGNSGGEVNGAEMQDANVQSAMPPVHHT